LKQQIHDHPEIGYEEHQAHDNICALYENLGYSVTRHAYGLETSFKVEYGEGGRLVVFNAEYDALPGIGHACGHNLIATGSAAAFIAAAEAIRDNHIQGRVCLLGCPAEESGGGKIRLLRAGAYEDVDACLQGHPAGPSSLAVKHGRRSFHGIAATKSTARKQVNVTFKGTNAHAGMSPWEGKNALDALVASYVNISLLRQQIPPTARIHGIVRHGGDAPNIIPDMASLEYGIRHSTAATVDALAVQVDACFQAGAMATGCTVDCSWHS
jgi:amidohydrolase